MIKIPIIEGNNTTKPIYYKSKFRFSNLTDINIISNELIVLIHRFAGKVYLIKLNYENDTFHNFTILDSIKIKYGNVEYR
jgi:hypothetical protein